MSGNNKSLEERISPRLIFNLWTYNTDLFRSDRQVGKIYINTQIKRFYFRRIFTNKTKIVNYLWNCSNKLRGIKFSKVYLVVRILLFIYSFDTFSYSSLKLPKQGITILCLPIVFVAWWHLLLELLLLPPSLPSVDISCCQRYRVQRMGSAIASHELYNPRSVLYLERS